MQDEAIDLPNTVEVVFLCCQTCVFCYCYLQIPDAGPFENFIEEAPIE